MKNRIAVLTAIGLIAVLAVPMDSFAKGPGGGDGSGSGSGYGGGSGGGSGGGGHDDKGGDSGMGGGNSNPGVTKGELFGDLYVIVRNENGEPLYFTWAWDGTNIMAVHDADYKTGYVQPIVVDSNLWDSLPEVCFYEEMGLYLVPMNDEGEVAEGYDGYAQEVELGRLNLARSPSTVLDAGYNEALKAINAASEIGIDPCGRLQMILDGEEKTIDSPRENLALYKTLLIEGYLPGVTNAAVPAELDFLTESQFVDGMLLSEALDQAASFLAGAGDKGTEITVDEMIYLNNILGINVLQNNAEKDVYFNFRSYTYGQTMRSSWYDVEAKLLLGPVGIVFEDAPAEWEIGYYVGVTNMLDVVPFVPPVWGEELTGASAFAAAASDALNVLTYIHDRALPEIGVD